MRIVPPAAALALGLALLAGCSGGDEPVAAPDRPAGSPTSAPTGASTPTPTSTSTPHDRYVALGDSYTAAPLVAPTDVSTVCLRSGANYPTLVAEAIPGTRLTDVSCSGATTGNTTEVQTGGGGRSVPPQFDALRRGTDLVTIGLGGNDDGLFGTILGRCTQLAPSDPAGAPCQEELTAGGDRSARHSGTSERTSPGWSAGCASGHRTPGSW